MEGPHAWPFREMPMPVGSDLCVQDLPGAWTATIESCPEVPAAHLLLILSELMLHCHGCLSYSEHVPAGTVQTVCFLE